VHPSPTSAAFESTCDEKDLPFIYGQLIKWYGHHEEIRLMCYEITSGRSVHLLAVSSSLLSDVLRSHMSEKCSFSCLVCF